MVCACVAVPLMSLIKHRHMHIAPTAACRAVPVRCCRGEPRAPSSTERMRNLVSSYTPAWLASGPKTRSNLNCLRAPPRRLYTASSPSSPSSTQPAAHHDVCHDALKSFTG